jgi:hypothetical protein
VQQPNRRLYKMRAWQWFAPSQTLYGDRIAKYEKSLVRFFRINVCAPYVIFLFYLVRILLVHEV